MSASKNFYFGDNKPKSTSDCDHSSTSKDVLMGMSTGDRVCDYCGLVGSPEYFKSLNQKDKK